MATDLDDKAIQVSAEKVPMVMGKSHHFEWQVLEQHTIVYFLLSLFQVATCEASCVSSRNIDSVM